MNIKTHEIIVQLVLSNFKKTLKRLSKVSAGNWDIFDIYISFDKLGESIKKHKFNDDLTWFVYFDVKGEYPFASMAIFESRDFDCISKSFLGYSFLNEDSLNSKELLLSELGNILLNPMATFVSNTLKKSFMPTVPKCVHGKYHNLTGNFEDIVDLEENLLTIKITLTISFGKSFAKIVLFDLIPKQLQTEIERIFIENSKI